MKYFVACPPSKQNPNFSVWAGLGLEPGINMANVRSKDSANTICVQLAMFHKCRAIPIP